MSPVAFVVGESLIDVIERRDGTVSEHPGGSPLNVAIGLARLGVATRLHTRVGDDRYGREIEALLRREGVEATTHSVIAGPTSTARARLTPDGAATYEFDIDWSISHEAVGAPAIFHAGSLGACLAPGLEVVFAELSAARSTATVGFDPNVRPSLVGERDEVVAGVERFVAAADVVKASEEDLAWLYPGVAAEDVADQWRRIGPAIVAVTLGARGSMAWTRPGVVVSTGSTNGRVADTVGAGDSFMAGLLAAIHDAGLSGRGHVAALAGLGQEELRRLVGFASRCAAVTVSRPGADPPTRADLSETP